MEMSKVIKPRIRRGANTFGNIVYLGNQTIEAMLQDF